MPLPPVRTMQPDDAPSVARLLTTAFAPAASSWTVEPAASITERMVGRWQTRCARAWVVDAPGFGPVGAAFAVVQPYAGWIAGLGVHPAYQGIGAGRLLMDASLAFLDDAGCVVVGLEVSPSNGPVISAYARRGLRPVDVTLRLRANAVQLAGSGARTELHAQPLSAASAADARERLIAARASALPLSESAFLAIGPGIVVVCDPDAGLATTALEVREGMLDGDHDSTAAALRAAGHLSMGRGLRDVELDLALASGAALPAFYRLGFETVTTSIRMARPPEAYRQTASGRFELGRWSL